MEKYLKIKIDALSQNQIEEVNAHVEKLLWEQGVVVKDADVCKFFSEKGAKVSGSTIRLPKELLREALKTVPKNFTLCARNPNNTVTLGIGSPVVINTNSGMNFVQDPAFLCQGTSNF